MDQRLFILLFFTGVTPLDLSIPRKYYLIQGPKTWDDALTYCRTHHVDLATIENAAEMVQLKAEAQKNMFTSSAWIGLYNDVNSWRWSLGNEPLGSWTKWDLDLPEPNNNGGKQTCGWISYGEWFDNKCTIIAPFMCFDATLSGDARYIYYPGPKIWVDAQSYCRQHHTDLASARTLAEHSIIQSLDQSSSCWIGLFRDSWKWTDQTKFSNITWMLGEPNNYEKKETCVYLNNGQAADALCSYLKPFFCYRFVTKQLKLLRLKVQSDQNMNDPAVKVALLEKIKQKLGDHGLTDITLKWNVQPGDVVFHKSELKNENVNMSGQNCTVLRF